ncbi:MAG: methyltransferase domain-containing protein [Paracoccaceae bacterium]
MSGFEADWLALRAEADARARNPALAARLGAEASPGGRIPRGADGRLRVVDLGAGSGNNLRATAPALPGAQSWRLVDSDPKLLARATAPAGISLETVAADLAARDWSFLDAADLVTASAFFDLAGRDWLDALVAALAARRLPLYAVLSYDGHELWSPPHPLDGAVLTAFHADQRRDKGLGPALGPDAAAALADALRTAGFEVLDAPSPWDLAAPGAAALIAALASGSARAVADRVPDAESWRVARAGAARVTIGHRDLLALPG